MPSGMSDHRRRILMWSKRVLLFLLLLYCVLPLGILTDAQILRRRRFPRSEPTVGRSDDRSSESRVPSEQPASGPGGSDYKYAKVKQTSYGEGDEQFWIFEPEPRVESAPVIGFLHGWGGMKPDSYTGWIEHLVKRGNVVIYPRFQENLRERPPNMTPSAMGAMREALRLLDGRKHARADRTKFGLVGHSLGGVISANIAAQSAQEGLPEPKALMVVQPGDSNISPLASRIPSIRGNYGTMPKDIFLLVVVGDADRVVGSETAKKIFQSASSVPAKNKEFLTFRSTSSLSADHFSPLSASGEKQTQEDSGRFRRRLGGSSRGKTDALDFHGYWKLFDALTDAAFYGRRGEYADIIRSGVLWESGM